MEIFQGQRKMKMMTFGTKVLESLALIKFKYFDLFNMEVWIQNQKTFYRQREITERALDNCNIYTKKTRKL